MNESFLRQSENDNSHEESPSFKEGPTSTPERKVSCESAHSRPTNTTMDRRKSLQIIPHQIVATIMENEKLDKGKSHCYQTLPSFFNRVSKMS